MLKLKQIPLLALLVLAGCDKSSPLAPEIDNSPDWNSLVWNEVAMPGQIQGEWWRERLIYAKILEDWSVHIYTDTGTVRNVLVEARRSGESYNRLIVRTSWHYSVIYILVTRSGDIEFTTSSGYEVDKDRALTLPLNEPVHLRREPVWEQWPFPEAYYGNWHVSDGVQEIVVDKTGFTFAGEKWNVVLYESNIIDRRAVIQRNNIFKVLYFSLIRGGKIDIAFTDGFSYSLDTARRLVPNDTLSLRQWWSLDEFWLMKKGTVWTYRYDFHFSQGVYSPSSYYSSSSVTERSGTFRLEITNILPTPGGRLIEFKGSYAIDKQFNSSNSWKKIFDNNDPNYGQDVVTDTSWTDYNLEHVNTTTIAIERDSLWTVTDSGLVFAGPIRFHVNEGFDFKFIYYPGQPETGFQCNGGFYNGFAFEKGAGIKLIHWTDGYSGISVSRWREFTLELIDYSPGSV
ncbi:MAG: hypothetical protein V1794_09270 [Candidatus Glassbacteria bacterium]